MSSYGYQSDHINLIADNLRDRYESGFPILKELIQNADDAKARRLVFGLHQGFKGQLAHPLLQGPGLWVFNDGSFKKEDERAIRSFGLNSKAGESGSIGKFGLGMKSVFHLCEAFFYIAFDGQKDFNVFMNPWSNSDSDDVFHNDWDDVDDAAFDALRTVVGHEKLNKDCASWFMMWIPLRQRAHVPQKDGKPYGGIVDKYIGDTDSKEMQFLSEVNLSQKIQSIVPLLRHLESVELTNIGKTPGFKIQISFDGDAQRVDHCSTELVSTGNVVVDSRKQAKLRFRIQQRSLPGTVPFSEFQQLNVWPKTGRLNSDGIREPVPDKSEAEGAVLVSGTSAEGDVAKVDIYWAVFLPLEKGLSYEFLLPSSKQHYRIVLHGQFFVDAGRKGIAGFSHLAERLFVPSEDLDDADLHTGWNQAIAQQVILPLLLPTLAQFAQDNLNDAETEELARSILQARAKNTGSGYGRGFWETFKDYICNEQAWVRLITIDGPKWSHQKLTVDSRLLKLPRPPKHDLDRPWKVLPGLKQLADAGCLLIDEEASSLMKVAPSWESEDLLTVLNNVSLDQVCSETGLTYLISFLQLENSRYINDGIVQMRLRILVRTMLQREPLQSFREIRSVFQDLIALIKPEHRFTVGTKRADAITALDEATLKLLINADIEQLLVPMDLDPDKDSGSSGSLGNDDVRTLLLEIDKAISNCIELDEDKYSKKIDILLRAASEVLKVLDDKNDERARAVRVNKSLKVLSATCARTRKVHAISFDELELCHSKGLLFKQDFGAYIVASALAELLPLEQIWVVSAEFSGWMSQKGDQKPKLVPLATDANAAYSAIGRAGRVFELANLPIRSRFIRSITPTEIKGDEVIRGMRFLLHGVDEHHNDLQATLWINADKTDAVWVKLKCLVDSDSWNVVDSTLAGAIRSDDWHTLGIQKVAAEEIIAYMRNGCSLDKVNVAEFSAGEVIEILRSVQDEKLWKLLPLHVDINGQAGPINNNCYIDSENVANQGLLEGVRIIKLSDDKKLREIQQRCIPEWTASITIQRALLQSEPEKNWKLILNSLSDLSPNDINKIEDLRKISWVPLCKHGSISAEDVIDIDELSNDIDYLASETGYCYSGILGLLSEVRENANFDKLRTLFAKDKFALQRLGQLMAEVGNHSVGDVGQVSNTLVLLDSLSRIKRLPAWGIVKKVVDLIGIDRRSEVAEHLLKEIRQPLSAGKLVDVLNEISSDSCRDQSVVFNMYLGQLANITDVMPAALKRIQLLARDGSWMPVDCLCIGVHGVAKNQLLDIEQGRILAAWIDNNAVKHDNLNDPISLQAASDSLAFSSGVNKGPSILSDYFKPWRELMPSGPVGALFALLGPVFRPLAVEWLKPRSVDYFFSQLSWNDPRDRNSNAFDYKKPEPIKLDALNALDFIPSIFDAKEIEVRSLLGDKISVSIDSNFDSLLVGSLTYAGIANGRTRFQLHLHALPNPEQSEKAALSLLVRKTCELILREAYNQRDVQLGQLWESIEKSNQLELEVARRLILDRLPYDLRNFKTVKKNQKLMVWLDSFKKMETNRAEKNAASQGTEQEEKEISSAKLALSILMASDSSAQNSVLDGIRERVKQNQYSVSSIAFELFQNADDAVMELQILMKADSTVVHPVNQVGRFVMEVSDKVVRFIHWGRPVNYMGHGQARNESYGEDLQRMLILAASDKDATNGLTGKFGLGFKSLLLATDAPCLLSGDLKTKIVGGCLPEPWREANGAVDALQRHRLAEAPGLRGTVVEFTMNSLATGEDVLDRFSALAGLQCVFSKEIRSIQINDGIHTWKNTSSNESLYPLETGIVKLPGKNGVVDSHILNLRLSEACIAFRLGSRGFIPFQDDARYAPPSIWVTAPTRETAALGLILNSQFELDTGRGGLPHGEGSAPNLEKAKKLGTNAAESVNALVQEMRVNWDHVQTKFGLAKEVSHELFWASFWAQIPVREKDVDSGEASRLLHQFGQALYVRYIDLAEEIPNGLSGDRASFVPTTSITLALNSRWEKLYEPLAKWSQLVEGFPTVGWVSGDVAEQLKAALENIQISDMSVNFLLDSVPKERCDPEIMEVLSELLLVITPEESELVRVQMATFSFNSKDGDWYPGKLLLKEGTAFDDQFIRFAPSTRKLDIAYGTRGLSLIVRYAHVVEIEDDLIADWILAASPDAHDARVAGLRYLLQGADARFYILQKISGTWLEALDHNSVYLESFSTPEKNLLLVMFNPQPAWIQPELVEDEDLGESLSRDEALVAIRDWWNKNAGEQLEKFDRDFWPVRIPRQFDSAHDDRASWMTLFAIGLMQRHGRVKDQQNRGFIDKMQAKGFWDVFCNKDPRIDAQAWLNVLNEYGEQQIEDEQYSTWMDSFPRLYRVARWFETYSQIFQGLDLRDKSQIDNLLSPSADSLLSGSGIHAPSMKVSFRLGRHVVIRELLRAGALHSETAKSLAYKPGDAVKKLLAAVGFDELDGDDVSSECIYRVLCESLGDDATFNGAYDIPLIILSRNPELLQSILEFDDTSEEKLYA